MSILNHKKYAKLLTVRHQLDIFFNFIFSIFLVRILLFFLLILSFLGLKKIKDKCLEFCILSVFSGVRNLSSPDDLNSLSGLSGLNDLDSLISSKNLLSLNPGTKMTYHGFSMWSGSSKIHYFIVF